MPTLYLPYTLSTSGSGTGIWCYNPQAALERIDKVRKALSATLGCKTAICLSDSDNFTYNKRTKCYEITHGIAIECLRINVAKARQSLLFSQSEYTTVSIKALRAYLIDKNRMLKKVASRAFIEIINRTDVQIVVFDHASEVSDDFEIFENGSLNIEISGPWQSVEYAKISILVLLDELAGLFVDTLTMEAYLHPIIAGKKRIALNTIMHDTLTNIYMPTPLIGVKDVPHRYTSTIYITGSPENVQTAKACLEEAAARHNETLKYLSIPCIPRKLDWLCSEHREYLLKLMCDNATHITVPSKGFGDPILILVGSQQVGINRTLRMITKIICTFYVIKIFIDKNDPQKQLRSEPQQQCPESQQKESKITLNHNHLTTQDLLNRNTLQELNPSNISKDSPFLNNSRNYTTSHLIELNMSPNVKYHSANDNSSITSSHLYGTSYGTLQIHHSPDVKFKHISPNNTFSAFQPPDTSLNSVDEIAKLGKLVVYNTQGMNDYIVHRKNFSNHILYRDINLSFDLFDNNVSFPTSLYHESPSKIHSLFPSSSTYHMDGKSSQQQSDDFFLKSNNNLPSEASGELLRIAQITGAEIFHERDIVTIFGNEVAIKHAHKLIAQLQWLKSMHRLIVFQLELAAENREFVNGKKNGKINKIIKASGCNIVFQEPYNDYNILIEVQANQFSKALEGLTYLESEIPAETSFYIPESYHKRIIGVSGKNIQKIMKKYAVYIKFTNAEEFESLGGYFENIDNVIARTPAKNFQNLENLRSTIFEQLGSSYKQRTTIALSIPWAMHRLVIGQQACNLRDINCSFDVQVIFPYKEMATDYIYLIGNDSQVSLASDIFARLIPKVHSFKVSINTEISKSLIKKFFEFTHYLSSSRGVEIYASAPSYIASIHDDNDDPELHINLVYMPSKRAEMERLEAEILDFFSGNRNILFSEEAEIQDTSGFLNFDGGSSQLNNNIPPFTHPMGNMMLPCIDMPMHRSFNMYNCFDYKLLLYPPTCEEDTTPSTRCCNNHAPDRAITSDISLPKPINSHAHCPNSNSWMKFGDSDNYDNSSTPIVPGMPYITGDSNEIYMMRGPRSSYENIMNNSFASSPYYMRNDTRHPLPHTAPDIRPPHLEQPHHTQNPFYYPVYNSDQRKLDHQSRYVFNEQVYNGGWPMQGPMHTGIGGTNSLPYFCKDTPSPYTQQINMNDSISQLVNEVSKITLNSNVPPKTANPNSISSTALDQSNMEPLLNEGVVVDTNSNEHIAQNLPNSNSSNPPSFMIQRLASDFISSLTQNANEAETTSTDDGTSPDSMKPLTCQSFFSDETRIRSTINGDSSHTLRHTHQTPQRVGP